MDKDFRRKYKKMRCGLLHLLLIVGGATGLKDLTINVPKMVRSGESVTLSCYYDLEGLALYTIQWLFNDREFYRFIPDRKPPPPYSIFDVDGIQVNISKSNSHDVTLVNVSRELTGTYKCEVSAGSPSYHTGIQRAKMEVVDAPKTGPAIRTEKERIAVGETLRANCTSGKSRPAPDVTWKLNGETITKDSGLYKIQHYQTSHDNVTQSVTSFIEFRVTNSMFRKGYLHLRCTVFISDVYRKSADIEITEDTPRIASITGESPPFGHRANGCAGQNWPWNGNRGAAIIMAVMAATLFLMMTSLTMTVPPITNVLPRCEPTISR
ncbi:neural cell adhesion molecule L1 isoform X1 [Mycetomoellerius zeteki]|uniref:neural cell adhesion molecule L1 isoform X1 n=1 Tax=Mycetomoellerius zeteki TaxID=64791 RepID=UPI00084EBE11|nr:PREDICTED: neural cell adhesion molecule L1-like isoform X1 [Trachymyrmex zeteki]